MDSGWGRRGVEVHCVACGDQWAPRNDRLCACGRSKARRYLGGVDLNGPIEALWIDGETISVATGPGAPDWPSSAPAIRRQTVPFLL